MEIAVGGCGGDGVVAGEPVAARLLVVVFFVNQLRDLPQRHVLIAIIGLWALCPIALAYVGGDS
ncbi:hypothetical protein [Streptosporangium sp. KLBMP 9127]|nr:hypothetical protein [Streptosporangium sp. KLBMP 9127]